MSPSPSERLLRCYFPYGFPTSLEAALRFDLVPVIAAADLDPARESIQAVRKITHQINLKRAAGTYHPTPIRTEDLYALGLIVDALRYLASEYYHHEYPGALAGGRRHAEALLGEGSPGKVASSYVHLLPPQEIMRTEARDESGFLDRETVGVANRDLVDVEAILLYITMRNPATKPLRELFDDQPLQARAPYLPYVVGLEEYFEEQPPSKLLGQPIFHCLRAPIHASPHSLQGQLQYIRDRWAFFLPQHILDRITLTLDVYEEDKRLRGLGPGSVPVLDFRRGGAAAERECEAFSADRDWMSNVVLMAKNVHVWLDQLSKKHGRHLRHLSDIPDEELDRLARWGFRGLWLIGLWERSRASQKIKQYTGNPEAGASAYSLDDYQVAGDLGGYEAWRDLRDRAWQRGIRLASDMVPNHMGIDSRWVIEHPHWFLQLDHPPYPWYSFTGGDLSGDPSVGLFIEDGYWERRDAAVVFKRVDRRSGEERFIYHGNDGTSMPWNDTAQLNFLLPEVREGVLQTILHVARMFPIIRFDAAMTLAKRHFQRLWFPQPGDAGAIPSRAERGMTKAEFDHAFPKEFWREVVDRVAAEAPDTLLLAEAFWLMEGYFVRTLGMHRVYNSAFMNMLKMEENQKYRQTVKNVLEFSPEVLKRFVNFMSNPDERTAVEQFGKGDKYFGVCLLMVTMPGLPMFGHGQIEGFTEKYGMEYRRAYWEEPVDEHMLWRHETEIFPLMRKRRLFSGAENFALFDFHHEAGGVDENVFAYSNRAGDERALILYNNAYQQTAGSIHTSTAINVGSADAPNLARRSLAEALGLDGSDRCYYGFRDQRSGLEHLRSGRELAERGLSAHLDGYGWHAFVDWREFRDEEGRWTELAGKLDGRPVPSLDLAMREMELEPVLGPYRRAVVAAAALAETPESRENRAIFERELGRFREAVEKRRGGPVDGSGSGRGPLLDLLLRPGETLRRSRLGPQIRKKIDRICAWGEDRSLSRSLLVSVVLRTAGGGKDVSALAREWLLDRKAAEALAGPAGGEAGAAEEAHLAVIVATWSEAFISLAGQRLQESADLMERIFADDRAAAYLALHEHNGILWFNKERFENLVRALASSALVLLHGGERLNTELARDLLGRAEKTSVAAEKAGYQAKETLARLSS